MEESNRLEELQRAYSKDIIDIEEFEDEIAKELETNISGYIDLNTQIGLEDQVWLSEEKKEQPDPAKIESVDGKMHLPIKPTGGMWTSTYTPDEDHDSDWIRWCSTEGFLSGRHKWVMSPKPDIHVLVVDSLEDLKLVANQYEKDKYKGMDSSQIQDTVLDFPAIARDFDAMRLTKEGQWDTRLTEMDEPDLYGWDSECVLHFRWNWSDFEYIGKCDQEPTIEY